MSRVLPRRPQDSAFVTATDKWSALAEGAKYLYEAEITAEQFKQADIEEREDGSAWWEECVSNCYTMHRDDIASCGGWIMAMPTPLENVWQVYLF